MCIRICLYIRKECQRTTLDEKKTFQKPSQYLYIDLPRTRQKSRRVRKGCGRKSPTTMRAHSIDLLVGEENKIPLKLDVKIFIPFWKKKKEIVCISNFQCANLYSFLFFEKSFSQASNRGPPSQASMSSGGGSSGPNQATFPPIGNEIFSFSAPLTIKMSELNLQLPLAMKEDYFYYFNTGWSLFIFIFSIFFVIYACTHLKWTWIFRTKMKI